MKYYIDVGMYNGELLEKIISIYPPFDKYIGFEAVPQLCKEAEERFKDDDRVTVINKAVSVEDKSDVKFYMCYCKEKGRCKGKGTNIGTGSTLLKNKVRGNIDKSKFISVDVINFSQYILDNFEKDDEIYLKIDIEGSEYELLDHMIKTGAIRYINKLFCEWHYHKMKGYKQNKKEFKKKHYKLVMILNKYGFKLKGDNVNDEMDYIIKRMES